MSIELDSVTSGDGKLVLAYFSLIFTIDGKQFAVHDFRLLRTESGLNIANPRRKAYVHCSNCNRKIEYNANFCFDCGMENRKKNQRPAIVHFDTFHAKSEDARLYLKDIVLPQLKARLGLQ